MDYKFLMIIISVVCICYLVFQFIEYIQNYDYISDYVDKYKNYEYSVSPYYTYIDVSLFDPNDYIYNKNDKWRCYLYNNNYYGLSSKGMVLKDNNFGIWNNLNDCIYFIFGNKYLNYIDPCINQTNNFCQIFKSYVF